MFSSKSKSRSQLIAKLSNYIASHSPHGVESETEEEEEGEDTEVNIQSIWRWIRAAEDEKRYDVLTSLMTLYEDQLSPESETPLSLLDTIHIYLVSLHLSSYSSSSSSEAHDKEGLREKATKRMREIEPTWDELQGVLLSTRGILEAKDFARIVEGFKDRKLQLRELNDTICLLYTPKPHSSCSPSEPIHFREIIWKAGTFTSFKNLREHLEPILRKVEGRGCEECRGSRELLGRYLEGAKEVPEVV